MDFKAIIFDCDGVLIDSEALACSLSAKYVSNLGYEISTKDYMLKYMGKSFTNALNDIKNQGIDINIAEHKNFDSLMIRTDDFKNGLKSINHVDEFVKNLKIPYAIASGSSVDRLNYTLEITNLLPIFQNKIYSAEMVSNPKPAPDVFLLAAEKLGVEPKDCLVIEDGVHGTVGAKKAGMTVFGFYGASHMDKDMAQMLLDNGASIVFDDFKELNKLANL